MRLAGACRSGPLFSSPCCRMATPRTRRASKASPPPRLSRVFWRASLRGRFGLRDALRATPGILTMQGSVQSRGHRAGRVIPARTVHGLAEPVIEVLSLHRFLKLRSAPRTFAFPTPFSSRRSSLRFHALVGSAMPCGVGMDPDDRGALSLRGLALLLRVGRGQRDFFAALLRLLRFLASSALRFFEAAHEHIGQSSRSCPFAGQCSRPK